MMKNGFLKLTAIALSAALSASLLTGCNKPATSANNSTSTSTAQASTGYVRPDQPVNIKVWVQMHPNHTNAGVNSLKDVLAFQELEKRTNVVVDWTCVANATSNDAFSLLLASGDLPDAFFYSNLPADYNKIMANKAAIPLNDLINKYAPNLKKEFDTVPELKRQTMDDSGQIFDIPGYITNMEMDAGPNARMVIRQDWLKKLNLQMPKTIDDMYKVLKAFKDNDPNGNGKKDEIPYAFRKGTADKTFKLEDVGLLLFYPYGVNNDFYIKDGKVKFGPIEPDYKKGLAMGRKMFADGLIDPDSFTQTQQQVDKKIQSNILGAANGGVNNRCTTFQQTLKATIPDYDMFPMNMLTAPDGKNYNFQKIMVAVNRNFGLFISPTSKKSVEIMKWLDYMFTDEGGRLLQSGIEGQTYTMNNGDIVYKDPMFVNAERAKLVAGNVFSWPSKPTPLPKDWYLKNWKGRQDVLDSIAASKKSSYLDGIFPSYLTYTDDENKLILSKMNDINTYCEEGFAKFMLGVDSVDNFDAFVAQLKKMGIDDVLAAQQKAYDRYMKRK